MPADEANNQKCPHIFQDLRINTDSGCRLSTTITTPKHRAIRFHKVFIKCTDSGWSVKDKVQVTLWCYAWCSMLRSRRQGWGCSREWSGGFWFHGNSRTREARFHWRIRWW
jgi:hypothetical protein